MAEPLPPALFRRWVRAREEEEAGGPRVYRPSGYPLPPARGRDGIELRADGTLLEWTAGPVDAPVRSAPGRWTGAGPARLRLFPVGGEATVVELVAATDDLLQLRWP